MVGGKLRARGLFISSDGHWHNFSAFIYGTEIAGLYDEALGYSGHVAAGCHNPPSLSTVYVNCRNAESLS